MAPAHILRLPLQGSPGSHVLVRVVPQSSSSPSISQPLDLELTATEGEQAYVRTLQHTKVSRYRDPSSSLSDAEWEQCLTSLFLPGTLPAENLNVNAQIKDEETLNINIRKVVSDQTETVGTLTLAASESATEEISIFDWCNDVVEVRTSLEKELLGMKRRHAELEKLVADETAHFRELERSKNEFEAEHDSFLRDLLNEKKLKIRTQAQVLATAHVDEDKLADVSAKAKKGRKSGAASKRRGAVGASRKGKRKADGAVTPDGETDDETAADGMDIDSKPESPERDLEEQVPSDDADRTTEESETASESEPEPEAEPEPEPEPKKASRSSARKKGARASPSPPPARAAPKKSGEPPSSNLRGKSPADADKDKADCVPPPRVLPFKRKPAPAPAPADDESTASEASEL